MTTTPDHVEQANRDNRANPDDPASPTDTAGVDSPVDQIDGWRGVATEDVDNVAGSLADLLRNRSRALLGSLLAPHRRTLAGASALIGINTLCQLAGPLLVERAIDKGIPPLLDGGTGTLRPLAFTVLGYLAITLIGALTFNSFLLTTGRVGQDVIVDIRRRLHRHFQVLSLRFHERYTSGRVISRQTSDVEAIAELLGHGMFTLVTSTLLITGIAVVLVILDGPLALATLSVLPVLWIFTRWFGRQTEKSYRATREAVALVIVHFVESLGGIQAVQAFRREPRNQEIFEELDDRYRRANLWSNRLAATFGPGVQFLGRAMTAVVLIYGGSRVIDGHITVGVLAAFLLYLRRFFEPMQELSQFYNLFQAAAAATEKLSGVFDEAPSVPLAIEPTPLPAATGDVRFRDVEFAYGTDVVLHELDLHVPAGQTVAVVGATGAGKTTIARLLARFWDPTQGSVSLDGIDLRDLSDDDLRRAVVMVTQENVLFTGTIADNIAFGRPGTTRAEIEAAAAAIGADEFINALPHGFDTEVAKRGGRLSAGQRQLVAFARAFLADPAVLILDEATSSLDLPSERLVQQALRTLLADRTAVIIAHRLSTVEIADRVLVLDKGRVLEDGTPTDLIADNGRYAELDAAWQTSLA